MYNNKYVGTEDLRTVKIIELNSVDNMKHLNFEKYHLQEFPSNQDSESRIVNRYAIEMSLPNNQVVADYKTISFDTFIQNYNAFDYDIIVQNYNAFDYDSIVQNYNSIVNI